MPTRSGLNGYEGAHAKAGVPSPGDRRVAGSHRKQRDPGGQRSPGGHRGPAGTQVFSIASIRAAREGPDGGGRHAAAGAGRRAGPGRRERPKQRGRRGRRRVSAPAATVAIITGTAAVLTLLNAMGGGERHGAERSGTPGAAVRPHQRPGPPPGDGGYVVNPVTDKPVQDCLSVMNDDDLKPTLGLHRCDPDDLLERFRLVTRPDGTRLLKGWVDDELWCTTLDGPQEGAHLHLRPCAPDDPRQRFVLDATVARSADGKENGSWTIFRLVPATTRAEGMCVGIRPPEPTTVMATHLLCPRSGVQGFGFTADKNSGGTPDSGSGKEN